MRCVKSCAERLSRIYLDCDGLGFCSWGVRFSPFSAAGGIPSLSGRASNFSMYLIMRFEV